MRLSPKSFIRSLKDVYCRIGVTRHGVGVVAVRAIPKGVDPFKRCDLFGRTIKVPESMLEGSSAPEEIKAMVRDFFALRGGMYYVPDYGIDAIDKSFYLNHSRRPNIATKDGDTFRTMRRIKKGEELTVDYRTFSVTRTFVP